MTPPANPPDPHPRLVPPAIFIPRVLFGSLAGSAAAIVFTLFMRNYVLACVLGMFVALVIARLDQPRRMAALGFATGALAGVYLGAARYLGTGPLHSAADFAALALHALGGLALTGLVCAVYGWITGKVLALARKGQSPFF